MIGRFDFKLLTFKEPLNTNDKSWVLFFFFSYSAAAVALQLTHFSQISPSSPATLTTPPHTPRHPPGQHPDGADTHIPVVSSCFLDESPPDKRQCRSRGRRHQRGCSVVLSEVFDKTFEPEHNVCLRNVCSCVRQRR